MMKPPLATTIASLLVCSMIVKPSMIFAADAARGAAGRELARRGDYERQGRDLIEKGDQAMREKDYERAVANYKRACDVIPNAPLAQGLYNRALHSFCESSCDLAEQRITEGRYGDAESLLKVVTDERYDQRCKRAVVILARLETPDYYNKTIGPQFRANVEQVKQLFIEARGFYDSGRYDLANKRCDQILAIDRYNASARRLQEKIDNAKYDFGTVAYNETRADAMTRLNLAWGKPLRHYNVSSVVVTEGGETTATKTERIQRKLDRIIIPKLEFREATIREAVDFLKKKSVELDIDSEPGNRGVNIVLKLDNGGAGTAPAEIQAPAPAAIPGLEQIPAAPGAAPAPAGAAPVPMVAPGDARITVSLTNIPLIEALRYVTNLAGLKFKVEPYAVFVVPQSVNTDVLVTREWKVRPDLIPRAPGGAADAGSPLSAPATGGKGGAAADTTKGGSSIAAQESAKNWLISNGVQFNGAASAVYLAGASRLIVRNTQDQLDLIDTIISSGGNQNVTPQIEIEAKFVEIQQTNYKELSFDWTLGQAHIPGNQNVFFGGGTTGTPATLFPFVQPGGTPVGTDQLTTGLRSGGTAISANAIDALLFGAPAVTSSPALAALAGVFTDPQFQVVIRALNQKKGVDLLSAPRVTTKSGQRAVVEVIREFRYPTEFQPPQIPQTFGGNVGGIVGGGGGLLAAPTSNSFPVTPTTPTAFETRNTGVTLEVEPTIGPDNYTIDLNLVPQVVEFEGFINYGSPIQTTSTNPFTGVESINVITPNVINQPIFSTRKVTTSVSVFDGATVVLGGLMREDVQKVEDKVPLLGDIPILGRLFRSSVDQRTKTNFVMFVTARLMRPDGDPTRPEDEKEEVVETLATPEVPLKEMPLLPK